MRHEGRIARWKDDRGFGFIVPSAGGSEAFVHIHSFVNRGRRPVENDLVTYRLAADPKGRARAFEVGFVGDHPKPERSDASIWQAVVIAALFFASLLAAVVIGIYPDHVLTIYVVASGVAFMMYWWDKSAARGSRWRTAENTLHTMGLLGGWPGSLVAIRLFRHKSSKAAFRSTFWWTVILNCALLIWFASPV